MRRSELDRLLRHVPPEAEVRIQMDTTGQEYFLRGDVRPHSYPTANPFEAVVHLVATFTPMGPVSQAEFDAPRLVSSFIEEFEELTTVLPDGHPLVKFYLDHVSKLENQYVEDAVEALRELGDRP